MTISRTALGILKLGGESTFGTSASYSDYVRSFPVDVSGLNMEALVDEHMRAEDYDVARIPGAYRGQVVTKHYVHGFASAAPSSAPSTTSPEESAATAIDHILGALASAFGQIYSGGYVGSTTVGHGTGPETVTAANLSSFVPGQAVAWATGVTKRPYEIGWLKANDATPSPDAATLLQVPRDNPQGATLWGAHNLFVRTGDPFHDDGTCTSWTLLVQGEATDMAYELLGCRPIGLKIMGEAGKTCTMEITWGVSHVERANTGGAPTVPSWSYPQPEICSPWRLALGDASAVEELQAGGFEFDLGLTRVALPDGQQPSGVGGYFATSRRPTLKIQVPRDYDRLTDFEAQTARPLTLQWGSAPGKLVGICLPAARLVEDPKPVDKDGGLFLDLVYAAQYWAGDTSGPDDEPANSVCRMVFA